MQLLGNSILLESPSVTAHVESCEQADSGVAQRLVALSCSHASAFRTTDFVPTSLNSDSQP